MDGEVEFVGDGFVGHALHNAGDDFFFALAQGFLFAVFFLFLLGVQQVVDFGGDDIYVIAHGEVLVIFLQYVVVNDGAYHSNVLDAGFSVFCLEGGQVEPATESGVDDDNVCRMHVNVVLQRFRRRNLNRVCIQVGNTLQNSRQTTPDDDRSFCNDNLQRSIIVHFSVSFLFALRREQTYNLLPGSGWQGLVRS